jgi:hypothetical protein
MMRPQDSPAHIPQRVGPRRAATPVPNRADARSASMSGYSVFLADGEPRMRCSCSPGTWDALRLHPHGGVGAAAPECPGPPAGVGPVGRDEDRRNGSGNGRPTTRKPVGTVRRESERSLVPWKPGNRTRRDPVEGRECGTTESLEGNRAGASKPGPVFTKQQRIAELAQQSPPMGFTSLNHHLDLIWLMEASTRTRSDAAPGVDGQTAEDYGLDLLANLESLRDRAKSGTYRAPPVRRVRIPKGTGTETRPLGIPTLGDQVLQRAVVRAREPIYAQDFLPCS